MIEIRGNDGGKLPVDDGKVPIEGNKRQQITYRWHIDGNKVPMQYSGVSIQYAYWRIFFRQTVGDW